MIEVWFERAIGFGLWWGIWLMVPLLVDVSTALVYFVNFIMNRNRKEEKKEDLNYYPFVTVVIPVHNSAETLGQCLYSIAEQSYPSEHIQVICVNNGSEDDSFDVFHRFSYEHPEMSVTWTSLDRAGKSIALNAGMYAGNGSYMMNVDADTWLDYEAILNVVKTFENDPTLAAATGSVRVDKILGEGTSFMDMINYCEVIEYIVAFDIGRRYQDLKNAIFTLSGAFSIFRRDIILQSFLYQTRTVSEDTDLTFNIRKAIEDSGGRIGFIADALAYVEPIESMSRLYSQRLRWQRGEVEVTGVYYQKIPGIRAALFDFVGRILISDHTLAILRLAWTFLLPFLYFLGYPLPTIVIALIGMFVCYFILEVCTFYIAYKGSTEEYQEELKRIWWIVFFMPLYRYLVYWFRLAGIIGVLTEEKSWKTENPVILLQNIVRENTKDAMENINNWRGRSKDE
ncbi:MAG: putative glycosyltransferase, exosortase G system-associated [Syntrophomonadaceae bacterium]|nr:putative glycosyltransferase, exosortase G system-associated [Syntrophomonadaceae bacterium]